MTNLEKITYNTFLKVSRSEQDLPFRYRKNFDNFETEPNYVYVQKLRRFFEKYPHINMGSFFAAPYRVYQDDTGFDLKFYTTQKAIKVYTLDCINQNNELPDSDPKIADIKQSLMYIYKFCRDEKICLDRYLAHMTNDINTFILHIREKKISLYVLFGFDHFDRIVFKISKDRLEFTLGSQLSNIPLHRTRYMASQRAKPIIRQGLVRLRTILNKVLESA